MSYSLEQDLLAAKQRAQAYQAQGAGTDPLTVSRLLSISRTWPTIAPGSALSFAQAGLDHTSDTVRAAAQLSASAALNQQSWTQALPKTQRSSGGLRGMSLAKLDTLASDKAGMKKLGVTRDQVMHVLNTKGGTKSDASNNILSAATGGLTDNIDPGYSLSRVAKGDIVGAVAGPSVQQAVPQDQDTTYGNINVTDATKAVTREAATGLNMPLQYVQGSIRNAAQGVSDIAHGDVAQGLFGQPRTPVTSQTDLGQQIMALQRGQDASLGTGWLPDPNSRIAKAQADAARQAAPTIGGHAFTLGRYGASLVFEPNTQPFNALSGIVDAGVAVKGDPSAAALSTLGEARQARTIFQPEDSAAISHLVDDTGLIINNASPNILRNTATAWYNSPAFVRKATPMIDMGPSEAIRYMKGDQLASRINPDLALQIGDATNLTGIRQAFHDTTLVQKPTLGGFGYNVKSAIDTKYLSKMPGRYVDPNDTASMWDQLDKTMLSAGVGRQTRNTVLDEYLRGEQGFTGAVKTTESAVKESLVANGISDEVARKAASMYRDHDMLARAYDIDQSTGLERVRPGVVVSDEGHVFPSPTLDSERQKSLIQLPDSRQLRQLSSKWAPVLQNPTVQNVEGFADGIINTWKTAVVARPALLAKVTLEQQLNAAARGQANIFTHPFQWLSVQAGLNAGMDTKYARLLDHIPGIKQAYLFGPDGAPVLQDADNLLQHSIRYTGQDPSTLVTHNWLVVDPTHDEYGTALAESLGRMYSDPVMRGVAQAESPAAAKEWFWSGEGQAARLDRAKITALDDTYNAQKAASDPRLQAQLVGDLASDRQAADRYIDETILPKLNDYTRGSDELMQAVRTGQLNGRDLYSWHYGGDNLSVVDKQAADYAKSLTDQGFGPQRGLPLRQEITAPAGVKSQYRRFMDMAFHYMIDAPDRTLNRSPAYAHFLWDNTAHLAPYINPDELPKLQQFAREANLPADVLSKFDNVKLDTSAADRLSLDQITQAAKAKTLGYDLPKTVHDLTSRTHIMDALRMVVPFGDAWRLIMQRTANIIKDEPQVIERARQALMEAQQPGSSTINQIAGDPVNPGDGFFHTDPVTHEGVFTIPGSTLLTRETLGVPIPLLGQVKGLSMLGDTYPGLGGPMLTLPAKWLIPDTPIGSKIKDEIFKYGGSQSEDPVSDVTAGFVPSWLTKFIQGAPDQRTFNSTVGSVMKTLASTGDYNLHDPNELARLAQDAKHDARWLYVIRGAAQFLTPVAPSSDTRVYDKAGKLREAEVLANKYYEKSKTVGPNQALQWVIDNFGTKNIFLTQAASQPTSFAAPTTRAAQEWVDSHPGVADKYPLVYGLFAPKSDNPNDFDQNAYAEQFTKGERVTLNAKQQIAQAENRLGYLAYNRRHAQAFEASGGRPLNKDQRTWLSDWRAEIKKEFPGFDTSLAAPYDSTKRRADAIDQLQAAAKDPAILSTPAGVALQKYLGYRDAAIAQAKADGLASPFSAQKAAPLRSWLQDWAKEIITQHPEFKSLWQQIFSREFQAG